MRNTFIIVSCLLLFACKPTDERSEKYAHYFFDTMKMKVLPDKPQYFMILNPQSRCIACYLGAIQNIQKLSIKYHIDIFTNQDLSRYVEDDKITPIIDDDLKFIEAYPKENSNSNFLIFYNKELLFCKAITAHNVDSMAYFIQHTQIPE